MNSKLVLLIKAVVSLVIAFFMIFMAKTFLGWFLGSDALVKVPDELAGGLAQLAPPLAEPVTKLQAGLSDLVKLMSAFFGAGLVGIGLICFFASNATASALRKNVLISLAVADTIGFIFALIAQLKGAFTGLGWIIVLLWLVLAALLAYSWSTEKA